jgi:SAM-dependent methyltransferase
VTFFSIHDHPQLKQRLKTVLQAIGYDTVDWVRVVMYRECFKFLRELGPENLDVLEISGGVHWRREFDFKSYTTTKFPGFDVCAEALPRKFDVVIADQVFEHLAWPSRAARNIYKMVRPGGYFIIATPFLLRVHNSPIDCSRWTPTGLQHFLEDAGFDADRIQTGSWGNRACVRANFKGWPKRGLTGSLKNEPDFPVMVWAFAQKSPLDAAWEMLM